MILATDTDLTALGYVAAFATGIAVTVLWQRLSTFRSMVALGALTAIPFLMITSALLFWAVLALVALALLGWLLIRTLDERQRRRDPEEWKRAQLARAKARHPELFKD
jgi:putative flippase GtrA